MSLNLSDTKQCSICKEEKALNLFKGKRCRECRTKIELDKINSNPELQKKRRVDSLKWQSKNPEKRWFNYRNSHLKFHYNITLDQYNEMLKKQNGLCAICNQEETWTYSSGKVASLAVDHCHKTGKVRGLLCRDCNQSIGKFKDDYNLLRKAYEYLYSYTEGE